jgi:hypothetical protein
VTSYNVEVGSPRFCYAALGDGHKTTAHWIIECHDTLLKNFRARIAEMTTHWNGTHGMDRTSTASDGPSGGVCSSQASVEGFARVVAQVLRFERRWLA